MADFNTTVLREKFVIQDRSGDGEPIIALSNRMALTLIDSGGRVVEHIVIRAQTLHTTIRLAAQIWQTFHRTGPLLSRHVPMNWESLWNTASGEHERTYNPNLWGALYAGGKIIFQAGTHHTFLDVIEQCETRHKRNYEHSLLVAEEMFMKAGHPVSITYDSNVAMILNTVKDSGKCGVILRGAQKTGTFNFHGDRIEGENETQTPVQFLTAAAAFLEGIQLCFTIGTKKAEQIFQDFSPYSEEGKILKSAQRRLGEMNATLGSFENTFSIHYRPEKPDFSELIDQAEELARRRLESLEQESQPAEDEQE